MVSNQHGVTKAFKMITRQALKNAFYSQILHWINQTLGLDNEYMLFFQFLHLSFRKMFP